MLIKFTVGNFKSFKAKATISLEATGDDSLEEDNVAHIASPNLRLLKAAAIYGKNAGGKSNFVDAMTRFRMLVLGSSKDSQLGESIPVAPFRLSSETEEAPTYFEIVFLQDETRYRYGFETTPRAVISEWLFTQAGSIRETRLFTREGDSISLGSSFKEGRGLEERTRSNALFVSVVAQFNGRLAGEVLRWLSQFRAITTHADAANLPFSVQLLNDQAYALSILELIKQADTGIEELIKQDIEKDKYLELLPNGVPTLIRDLIAQNPTDFSVLKSVHQRFNARNEPAGKVEFDFVSEESAGTRQFLALAGPFLHTLREGAVLVVDELDAKLHPLLTRQLVAMFNSSANRKNAQLIFATHDQGLLDHRRIRRDQVWFVEKDEKGVSDLFCLAEIRGVRKDANFEREYLLGQFGGVPHLGDLQKVALNADK